MPFSRLRKKIAAIGDWLVYDDVNSARFLQLVTDTILRNESGDEAQIGLRYADPDGNEDWRPIRPIAWGSSKAGNTLLVAYREPFTDDDFRTYSLSRITGIMVQEGPSPVSEVTDEETLDEVTDPDFDESAETTDLPELPEDSMEEPQGTIPQIPGAPEVPQQQETFEIPYNPDYVGMDEPDSGDVGAPMVTPSAPVVPFEQPIQQFAPEPMQQPAQVVDVNSLPPQLRPANLKRLRKTIFGKN